MIEQGSLERKAGRGAWEPSRDTMRGGESSLVFFNTIPDIVKILSPIEAFVLKFMFCVGGLLKDTTSHYRHEKCGIIP